MVASLPPSEDGGLGIRIAVQLTPIAYLSSAAVCPKLVSSILPPWLRDTPNPWLSHAKAICQNHNQHPLLPLTVITSGHGTLQERKSMHKPTTVVPRPQDACLLVGHGYQGGRSVAECPPKLFSRLENGQRGLQDSSGASPWAALMLTLPLQSVWL